MPIYAYRCKKCGHEFEIRQPFGVAAPEECPLEGCDGRPVKVFTPPAIVFRGSGFHVNDYGRGSKGNGEKRPSTGKPDAQKVSSPSKEE